MIVNIASTAASISKQQQQQQVTFSTLLRTIENARCFRNFPAKNKAVIERDLYEPRAAVRVNAALVVVPDPDKK
jgi:hypothetical protein